FSPLKLKIQRAFDRYLYREPYDYQRTIREASEALRGTIDLPALADYVTGLVGHILKPEGVAIYLLDEDEGRFERVSSAPPTRFPEVVLTSSPLVSVLLLRQELIFRDELFGTKRSPHLLDVELDQLGVAVVAPLIEEEAVMGFLCVGDKRC